MPSSTAPISCSREICFSALSWRRAPTKSRLTMASVLRAVMASCCAAQKKKRGGHPRRGAAVQLAGSIHPEGWTLNGRPGRPDHGEWPRTRDRPARRGPPREGSAVRGRRGDFGCRETPPHVVLEDLDEFGDQ